MKFEISNKYKSRVLRDFNIPSLVFKSDISSRAKILYGYILQQSNEQEEFGTKRVAKILNIDEEDVIRYLQELCDEHLIDFSKKRIEVLPLAKSKIYKKQLCDLSCSLLHAISNSNKTPSRFLQIMFRMIQALSTLELDKKQLRDDLAYLRLTENSASKSASRLLAAFLISLYDLTVQYKDKRKELTNDQYGAHNLIKVYYEEFEKMSGEKPSINREIDPGILRNLLKKYDFDTCKQIIIGYFKIADDFIVKSGYAIRFIPNSVNKILVKNAAMNKGDSSYASEFSESQLNEYFKGRKDGTYTGKEDWAKLYEKIYQSRE